MVLCKCNRKIAGVTVLRRPQILWKNESTQLAIKFRTVHIVIAILWFVRPVEITVAMAGLEKSTGRHARIARKLMKSLSDLV